MSSLTIAEYQTNRINLKNKSMVYEAFFTPFDPSALIADPYYH